MKQNAYLMPQSDCWIIEDILLILSSRLSNRHNDSWEVKRVLLRTIFALQRLPHFTEGISISLGFDNYHIEIGSEQFGFSYFTNDGHEMFRLKYFECSYHCILGFDILEGDEKKDALENHLEYIANVMEVTETLTVEDYSEGNEVDIPPVNAIWGKNMNPVFLVQND